MPESFVLHRSPGAMGIARVSVPVETIRQKARPVSPECSVDGTCDQSVVVKGSSGIFIVPANKCPGQRCAMNARTANRVLHSSSLAPGLA